MAKDFGLFDDVDAFLLVFDPVVLPAQHLVLVRQHLDRLGHRAQLLHQLLAQVVLGRHETVGRRQATGTGRSVRRAGRVIGWQDSGADGGGRGVASRQRAGKLEKEK